MTNPEFSDAFDTLLNSFSNQIPFGEQSSPSDTVLNEFEKSLLLTQAQDEVVLSLYTGRSALGKSFEETEELRRYLSKDVKQLKLAPITDTEDTIECHITEGSYFFDTSDLDIWFIVYEAVKVDGHECGDGHELAVTPITVDEYHRIKKNPFRSDNDRRALRIDYDKYEEIICKYKVTEYLLRYLKKLSPIILEDLPDGLTIKGEYKETPCKLNSAIHQLILETAVSKALATRKLANMNFDNVNNK